MGYSVITQKWIPVTYLTGESQYLSIRDIFEDAHKIKCISDNNEMTNLGILRLLIVFFMDAYKMEHFSDREELFNAESFDISVFDAYVSECEKIGNCFDLFDEYVPFLQTGNMSNKKISQVSRIGDFECNDTEVTFFNGKLEKYYEFTPAECVRRMCQRMSTVFKSQQGGGFQAFNPLLNAIFMLNKCDNLKDTIIMNSVSKREWIEEPGNIFKYGTEPEMKGPVWRHGTINDLGEEKVPIELSLLGMMTFMTANIKLIIDDDGKVRNIYFTSKTIKSRGKERPDEKEPFMFFEDPMTVIEITENKDGKESHKPLTLDPSVGLWEVLDALHVSTKKRVIKPLVLRSDLVSKEIETWSPCKKDGKTKGIVFHDIFQIKPELLNNINVETVKGDSENFASIIENFGNKKMKEVFNKLSDCRNYLTEIQREFRQYMNIMYISHYLDGMAKLNKFNFRECMEYRKKFMDETIEAFHKIALDKIDRIPGYYKNMKQKEQCKKQINSYFYGLKKKEEV